MTNQNNFFDPNGLLNQYASPNFAAIYGCLLAFIFIFLSFKNIGARWKNNMPYGESEDGLYRAHRAHRNFSEYTPIFLILLYISQETLKNSTQVESYYIYFFHFVGSLFVFGRVLHGTGLLFFEKTKNGVALNISKCRVIGMVCTIFSIGLLAGNLFRGHLLPDVF